MKYFVMDLPPQHCVRNSTFIRSDQRDSPLGLVKSKARARTMTSCRGKISPFSLVICHWVYYLRNNDFIMRKVFRPKVSSRN